MMRINEISSSASAPIGEDVRKTDGDGTRG